jgi:hypothetical protein
MQRTGLLRPRRLLPPGPSSVERTNIIPTLTYQSRFLRNSSQSETVSWTRTEAHRQAVIMKLRRLCKAEESVPSGQCPALYLADDPTRMVGQGKRLDDETRDELLDFADDEGAFEIPTETVLRAAAMVLAEAGRPGMVIQVEAYLAAQSGDAG